MAETYPSSNANPSKAMPVWIAPAPAGAGISTENIAVAGNTQVKTGSGTFIGLTINTGEAGAQLVAYDGTDASGKKLGTYSLAAQGSLSFPGGGIPFATGLFLVTSGGTPADITVSYL
jgi:hypothetical protein